MKGQFAYSSSQKVQPHKDIRVEFTGKNLTKFGGIQLVRKFLRGLKVKEELESAVGIEKRDGKFSVGGRKERRLLSMDDQKNQWRKR